MSELGHVTGRQRSGTMRSLQAEGIVWEGQVYITGHESDVAARLVVTHQRIAFIRAGEISLEVPREWLRPAPHLGADGSINLLLDAEGNGSAEPFRIVARDGRRAAAHVVSLLAGSGVRPVRRTMPLYVSEPVDELPTPPMARSRPSSFLSIGDDDEMPGRREPIERERIQLDEDEDRSTSISMLDFDDFPPLAPSGGRLHSNGVSVPMSDGPPTIIPAFNAPISLGRDHDWNLQPLSAMSHRSSRGHRKGWAIRLSGLLILLFAAAAIGSGRVPSAPGRDMASHFSGTSINAPFLQQDDPTRTVPAVAQVVESPTATASAPAPTNPAPLPSVTGGALALGEAEGLGVGGMTVASNASETSSPTATDEPVSTATSAPPATDSPEPTAVTSPTTTIAATNAPDGLSATTQPANTAPADEPTAAASTTPTPLPTATPTSTPTPTAISSPTPTASPTPTPKPSFPSQRATLGDGELPDQAFSEGAIRYTVEAALRAPQFTELELPAIVGSEWVVVTLHVDNWSAAAADLLTADFSLYAAGPSGYRYVAPDPSSGAIAANLGFDPALGPTDVSTLAPGDSLRIALIFVIAPDSNVVQLMKGWLAVDLADTINQPVDITDLGDPPGVPELVEATVVDVLDGRTIEVSANGQTIKVRYLGIDVPAAGQCYASEATAANAALVEGQTVWLERERKNRVAKGEIGRDVWVNDSAGHKQLVSALLASQGAATSSPVEPDVRFSGWILAAAGTAQYNALGIWGACGGLQAAAVDAPADTSFTAWQTTNVADAPIENGLDTGVQPPIEQSGMVRLRYS